MQDSHDRLDSWKEIAAYLGREVRTVQAWEKNEGLPVHRHQHARQGSVYAFRAELDAWRDARKSAADPPAHQRLLPRLLPAIVLIVAAIIGLVYWKGRPSSPAVGTQ